MFRLTPRGRIASAIYLGTQPVFSRSCVVVQSPKEVIKMETEGQVPARPSRFTERKPFPARALLDLFINKFDDELLFFPEIMTDRQWGELIGRGEKLEHAMNKLNYKEVLSSGTISAELRKQLAELNLFRSSIPIEYGGYGYTATENRYIHEIIGLCPSIARLVSESEEMAIRALVMYGSEEQKQKYLPKIASGESTVAFAFLEPSSTLLDPSSYRGTKVTPKEDRFILEGKKSWVYDAKAADHLIVFTTQDVEDDEGVLHLNTLFIVEARPDKGVTVFKPMDKAWFRGWDVCDVLLDNVEVGPENILGGYGKGFEILKELLKMSKTHMSAECTAAMKRLVHNAVHICKNNKLFNKLLAEYSYVSMSLGEMSALAYAVESMTYYVASRYDYYEKPDLTMDSLITKIFASEALLDCLHMYFSLVGNYGYRKTDFLEELVQNAHYYSVLDDTNYNIKLFIASEALIHAGKHLAEKVRDLRSSSGSITRHMMFASKKEKHLKDEAKSDLKLYNCVCPQLADSAHDLEYCINRLQFCVMNFLVLRGEQVMKYDYHLMMLSEIFIHTYAAMACIARANRSVSRKLENYKDELSLTLAFTSRLRRKVRILTAKLIASTEETETAKEIGRKVLQNKTYLAEHPLMRNF